MSARQPLHTATDQAEGLPHHQWRVNHVDAKGRRRITTVTAASSWLAMNWVEQLYGLPRACAAIRITPSPQEATARHA